MSTTTTGTIKAKIKVIAVYCPYCKAQPGQRCHRGGTWRLEYPAHWWHDDRERFRDGFMAGFEAGVAAATEAVSQAEIPNRQSMP